MHNNGRVAGRSGKLCELCPRSRHNVMREADDQRHGRVIAEPSPSPQARRRTGHLNLRPNPEIRFCDWPASARLVFTTGQRVVNPRCLDPFNDVIAFAPDAYD
jgi:hypothetical protein